MRGLFVTATDTGAGKTYLTAAIARTWRRQGRAFRVTKPVASGAEPDPRRGDLVSEDTQLLADAAGVADLREVTPWTFRAPAAPTVAARLEGVSLTIREIADHVRGLSEGGRSVLVEGVGGLLCPLCDAPEGAGGQTATVADLAVALRLPLIVAARRALGTLNHTLLTLEAARGRGLDVAGVVVCETGPEHGLAEATAPAELRRLGVPLLAVLPHRPGRSETIEGVDFWALAGRGLSG